MGSPLDEVLEALQALLDARRETPVPAQAGRGNFRCENCVDCSHCRFCTDCTACEDCTYCEGCEACTGCTHCKHCDRCKQTTHSAWSSECTESSYLTLCLDCKACVQCFACVGLQSEEFCILNEKLPRKAYFSRVAALRGALDERIASGWLPPWAPEDEEPDDEADEEHEADEPSDEADEAPSDEDDDEGEDDDEHEDEHEDEPLEPEPAMPEATPTLAARAGPETRSPPRAEPRWMLDQTMEAPEPPRAPSHAHSTQNRPAPLPEPDAPNRATAARASRSEITADVADAEPPDASYRRPPRATPPWTFADARRHRSAPVPMPEPPDAIPEPPPFGSGPHPAARPHEDGAVTPRGGDEPTRRRQLTPASEPTRDRYAWSVQAEGTPVRVNRSLQDDPQADRPRWTEPEDEDRLGWSVPEPRDRWATADSSSSRWSRRELGDAIERPRRSTWDDPPARRHEPSAEDMVRRRRETAASPSARPGPADDAMRLGPGREAEPRQLDVWSAYEEVQRSRPAPEDRTEPDAPVVRRGSARADLISGAATTDEDEVEPSNPPARVVSRTLSAVRRPERPAAPEPRERTPAALLRGRAPARPTPTPPPRQSDAPSLRRARRPTRGRDESPTSEYEAVDGRADYDPERS